MTNKYDFFSKMILDYFVSIDDSYDYMIYINGKNADISSTLRQFNIVDEIIEDNYEFVVSKFSKYCQYKPPKPATCDLFSTEILPISFVISSAFQFILM